MACLALRDACPLPQVVVISLGLLISCVRGWYTRRTTRVCLLYAVLSCQECWTNSNRTIMFGSISKTWVFLWFDHIAKVLNRAGRDLLVRLHRGTMLLAVDELSKLGFKLLACLMMILWLKELFKVFLVRLCSHLPETCRCEFIFLLEFRAWWSIELVICLLKLLNRFHCLDPLAEVLKRTAWHALRILHRWASPIEVITQDTGAFNTSYETLMRDCCFIHRILRQGGPLRGVVS